MKNSHTPLTESMFLILASLIQPLHGYGIMQEIEKMSHGRVRMGPGTLYGGLNTLLGKKLIKKLPSVSTGRKKMYRITDTGRTVLQNEYARLKQLVTIYENATT